MSSHHFVKEDQEPALIIQNAESVPFSTVEELLEWSPTVIVMEQALKNVLEWGIKIDVVISAQENVPHLVEALKEQAPVKILSHQPDENPTTTAFYFLTASKYRAVNVIGMDMQLLKSFAETLDVVSFSNGTRWIYARNGKFEKWLSSGSHIQVISDAGVNISRVGLDEQNVTIDDGVVSLVGDKAFWVGEVV